MSYPSYFSYGRVQPFSPLNGDGGQQHQGSPGSYQQQWTPFGGNSITASPELEMHATMRPALPNRPSGNSLNSSSSTQYPSAYQSSSSVEEQSFLHNTPNKTDTIYSVNTHQPYKDHTGRQLRHILIGSSFRWFITAGLCAAYIVATRKWNSDGALTEPQKRVYNAITTAISIAMSLNIASAFKDLALNMRWPILSARKRSLVELDLILNADSMMKLARLAFVSRRPVVILSCITWLILNITAQAGIAMLNLTYGFEVNYDDVLLKAGNVSIPDMRHFWPQGNNTKPSIQDEEYIAHLYGGLAYNYGLSEMFLMPNASDVYKSSNSMLWYDYSNNLMEFIFSESPTKQSGVGAFSVYTARSIEIVYTCESHEVTAGGNGTVDEIEVANVGTIFVSHAVPDSISYFTNANDTCDGTPRCSVVQAFEASATEAWYYSCNVTLGETKNDPDSRSYISDLMAHIATSSIAQMGYTDETGQEAQIYPGNSLWGLPSRGDRDMMGWTIATFALGSIAGASLFNPSTTYAGTAPGQGFTLKLNHPYFFYLIIGLICGCQLIFCVIVAILANRVRVGPDSHILMSLLLRPIADRLEGVSGGRENSAYKKATKQTQIRYEKAQNGRWVLSMG